MASIDKKTAMEWAEQVKEYWQIRDFSASAVKANEIICSMQDALSNTAEEEGWYEELAELMGRLDDEKEKPFALDLDKTREIATRINSASPTPSQSERVHIEGAIWYATIYANHLLETFIEGWNETASYQNRPDLLWANLDDNQRHEALVQNADSHFAADLDLPDRFDRRMIDEMTLI